MVEIAEQAGLKVWFPCGRASVTKLKNVLAIPALPFGGIVDLPHDDPEQD